MLISMIFKVISLSLSSICSLKPQSLLQPHISHQLPGTRPPPSRRRALGLLVPLRVPGGLLLPAARCVRPLFLVSARHPLRPVLHLHSAEVRGRSRARGAAAVLHHGGVLHDGARGSVLASWRRGSGFTGRENRPPGHSDQAAQHQAEPRHRRPGTHRGAVDLGAGEDEGEGGDILEPAAVDVRMLFLHISAATRLLCTYNSIVRWEQSRFENSILTA